MKNQPNIKCEVCEYLGSRVRNFGIRQIIKKYYMCSGCLSSFNNYIIRSLLNDFIIPKSLSILKKKSKDILSYILKHTNDINLTIDKINEIFDKELKNLKNDTKYTIPFDNIEVNNSDDTFMYYTSKKKMKILLKYDEVTKIADKQIKFKKQIDDSAHSLIAQSVDKRKNECIKCGKKEYLKKICIFPRTGINAFIKANVLIHFWHAVCTDCIDFCQMMVTTCCDDLKKEIGKSCVEHINEHYENQNYREIQKFINYYIDYYKSITKKNTSHRSSLELYDVISSVSSEVHDLSSNKHEDIIIFSNPSKLSSINQISINNEEFTNRDSPFSPIILSETSSCSSIESENLFYESLF